jgi:hypothetical protein
MKMILCRWPSPKPGVMRGEARRGRHRSTGRQLVVMVETQIEVAG